MATIPRVTVLDPTIGALFGAPTDSMHELEARAATLFPGVDVIVWEGDAATFEFGHVSEAAERVLGYPARRWIEEATFWADEVVIAPDRDEAIGYCALATFRGADHTFEYRAKTADGRVVWLRDFVRVIGSVPSKKLRGVMFDVTAEKQADATFDQPPVDRVPSRAQLEQT